MAVGGETMTRRVIQIVPFQEHWRAKYEAEHMQLRQLFKDIAPDIEHIGSTSVRGLDAKPIIDIAVRLGTVAQVPDFVEVLARLGYGYEGEFGLPGRHFFIKGKPRAFHLHLVDDTTNHWRSWISFREALRGDPELCQTYQRLKHDLAHTYRFQPAQYSEAKSEFINAVVRKLI